MNVFHPGYGIAVRGNGNLLEGVRGEKRLQSIIERRGFLASFAGAAGVATTLGLRGDLFAQLAQAPAHLPERSLYDSNEEAYWTEMRKHFLIPADEVYLNNGTVGSSPAPVLRAIFDGYNETEKMAQSDPEDYPIWADAGGT